MVERRALRIRDGKISVLTEGRFDAEFDLQQAFVNRADLLPGEDLGLGTLVALGWELDMGAGPMDLLAVDAAGRLVIVEFKKGTENPDVRTVVAQMLDYGSALWQKTPEVLEQKCQTNGSYSLFDEESSIDQHVRSQLAEVGVVEFDPDSFRAGVSQRLADGRFVFAYVARDLNDRTRRVLTYLADGAGLAMFAVEVDNFRTEDRADVVLVPRVAFVPAKIIENRTATPADPHAEELILRSIKLAKSVGLSGKPVATGHSWPELGVGAYRSGFSVEVARLKERLSQEDFAQVEATLCELMGRKALPPQWWTIPASALVPTWDGDAEAVIRTILRPAPGLVTPQ